MISNSTLPTDARPFEAFLRTRKLKLTRERKAILAAIARRAPHFDAEELLMEFQNSGNRVSRATVYRTLNLLVRCGLVQKNNLGSSHACYEAARGRERHDHLICIQCGKVFDLERKDLGPLHDGLGQEPVFAPLYHNLQIFGLCGDCLSATDEKFILEQLAGIP
jgi:Fur family ferric uptake transcriptional regulator